MNFFKTILIVFMFLGMTSACNADSVPSQLESDVKLNYKNITPTSFSTQLKKSTSYNVPSYNSPRYNLNSSGLIQDPVLNATMNGLMNYMTLGADNNSYSNEMLKKQQEEEYIRQQVKYTEDSEK